MLVLLTLLIMIGAAWAGCRKGLAPALFFSCNLFIAGLIAFDFWEPLAGFLEPGLQGTFLDGYEDAFFLVLLFGVTLYVLQRLTRRLDGAIEFPPPVQRWGGAGLGLIAGYLTAGLLVCVLETLPVAEHFLGLEGYTPEDEALLRAVLPPDRVWRALLRHAGAYPLANQEDPAGNAASRYDAFITFDKYATFELRYARYRRHGDNGKPLPYRGELDREIHRPVADNHKNKVGVLSP